MVGGLCPGHLGQLEAEAEAAQRGTVSPPQPASLVLSCWHGLGHGGQVEQGLLPLVERLCTEAGVSHHEPEQS